jgi:hypothetical protein
LRGGEKLGKDTEDAGAESAQLERMAYVTLAIGGDAEHDGHGWSPRDLSVGKSRMGTGDVVVPVAYHGLSGRFAWAGEAEMASKARVRKAEERDVRERKAQDLKHEALVRRYLASVSEPVSRTQVEESCGGRKQMVGYAIRRMVESGEVVEVGGGERKGYKPKLRLATNPHQPPRNPHEPTPTMSRGGRTQQHPPMACEAGGVVDVHPASVSETGGVEVEAEEWQPNAQCRTYADAWGLDLDAHVQRVHRGPRVRDPDAVLMASLVRAAMSSKAPGKPQNGFLGFARPRKPEGS